MKNIMLGSDVETCGDHVDADVRSNALLFGLAPAWHPLTLIDNMLQAAGWTHEPDGWVAPEAWQEAIAIRHGRGRHWSRENAIRFTVRYYEREFSFKTI